MNPGATILPVTSMIVGALRGQTLADGSNALTLDANIGHEPGRARTVDDRAATQEQRGPGFNTHIGCLSRFDHAACSTGCVSLSTPRSCNTWRTRFNWPNAGGPRRNPVPTINISR